MSDKAINKLPSSWQLAKLNEVAALVRGVNYKKEESQSVPAKGFLPVLRATNITGVSLTFEDLVYVPQRRVSDDQILISGDVVIASSSGSKEIVGKAGQYLESEYIGSFGAFCTGIRPEHQMSQRFFGYYFQSPSYREVISEISAGSNINNIKSSELSEHLIPIAPVAEQTRIVEKLEELLSDLDAGVNELKTAQKKLGQYRQSLLKAAVEGELTADWRSKIKVKETGAQLLQRIQKERRTRWETKQLAKYKEQNKTAPSGWKEKYPEPVKPDTTDLPKLPEGWVWASAEQLCDFITKGTTPTKGISGATEKTIPFLRVTNLTDTGQLDMEDKVFVTDEIHRGFLGRSMVYPNDVLMNIVGPPLGQVSVVPDTYPEWNINQAIAIYRGVPGVLHGFLACCLLSPSMQNWLKARSKTTAGQTNLTLEVCRNLPIPLPPVIEQQALVEMFENHLNATKEQISVTEFSLKQSSAQRKNILKTAFSGQLVPQNPNDEPASVLLERIRAERAVKVSPSKKAVTQKIKTAKSKRVNQ